MFSEFCITQRKAREKAYESYNSIVATNFDCAALNSATKHMDSPLEHARAANRKFYVHESKNEASQKARYESRAINSQLFALRSFYPRRMFVHNQ